MEAKCLHDFNATADDELSFCRGTVIKVTACSSGHDSWDRLVQLNCMLLVSSLELANLDIVSARLSAIAARLNVHVSE